MSVFKPLAELQNVTSEKGEIITGSQQFSNDSIFGVIENNIATDSEYLFCDDLGNEWADFISIEPESLIFYHAKYGTDGLSASKFHDVVGQALKNLGNFTPAEHQWERKQTKWSEFYSNNGTTTVIKRCLKGSNVQEGIEAYKRNLSRPNTKRQISLVVNFISETRLKMSLKKVKSGEQFNRKNEVIQILWFLYSLVSNCSEVGVGVYIYCLP
jgi:hypothetical protein